MGYSRSQVIDSEGYRKNVGIIVSNHCGKLLWCRRVGQDAWQFPQGGVESKESLEHALYRELREETGLQAEQVELLGRTGDWLSYQIPKHLVRRRRGGRYCKGQKQIWFLLHLLEEDVNFADRHIDTPEFDQYCWVDYWYPVDNIIAFKRAVYRKALTELEPIWARNFQVASNKI